MKPKENTSSQTDWESLGREVQRDRRRGKRVPLAFPIEISGLARDGCHFAERTKTCDVSESGCRFRAKTQLLRGDVIAVRLLIRRERSSSPSKPVLFQIAWATRDGEGWMAGAMQLDSENLWGVDFPKDDTPGPSTA